MFATHYYFIKEHLGTIENSLCFKMMDHLILDEKQEKIKFLYKIVDGVCLKSFAFNVARISGLNESIIKNAMSFTKEYRKKYHI